MTNKELAFKEINETQEFYINELIKLMNSKEEENLKTLNFSSPTGTGKTNMMSLLINKMPEKYFIITTLSKGQLHIQIKNNLERLCNNKNFKVYGLCDYKINSKLTEEDIVGEFPEDVDVIWLRDEGHINTNKWLEILENRCWKIINFSATNKEGNGIHCNFTHTMMLRTVDQRCGTPEDAIKILLKVKKQHKDVKNYNPCAIFRCLDESILENVIELCNNKKLKYINITTEDFDMSELCKDNNEYDVIINKFKIVEGIDIRRAHVLYMDNEPANAATTIQVIGRCRRNALLYRKDINILAKKNKKLLEQTRKCYCIFNVSKMKIDIDETGELCQAFCDIISCQQLKENSIISAEKGYLQNGLKVIELCGATGTFTIIRDKKTGFNKIDPETDFYSKHTQKCSFNKIELKLLNRHKYEYSLFKKGDSLRHYSCQVTIDKDNLEKIKESVTGWDGNIFEKEYYLIDGFRKIACYEIDNLPIYENYTKIINDKTSAIIGVDLMKLQEGKWIEDRSVTNKIKQFSKLNLFLQNKYISEINSARNFLYTGKNSFKFNVRCNSCLGYCAEYYGKYLIFGKDYLNEFIEKAQKESKTNTINDFIIIRACMLKYKDLMISAFGKGVSKLIPTISIEQLIKDEYHNFVEVVKQLGSNILNFVRKEMGNDYKNSIDPNLSITHIAGLADFISKDKIIDIKCTNHIDISYIKQVLAYHYLSTKRSDLNIKEVIIYDAVRDKYIKIKIGCEDCIETNVTEEDLNTKIKSSEKILCNNKKEIEVDMNWSDMPGKQRQIFIKKCLEEGYNYREIERSLNVGKGTVGGWYREHKDDIFEEIEIKSKNEISPEKNWIDMNSNERIICIEKLRSQGYTFKDMENAWNTGNGTVKSWYKDNKNKKEVLLKNTDKKTTDEIYINSILESLNEEQIELLKNKLKI